MPGKPAIDKLRSSIRSLEDVRHRLAPAIPVNGVIDRWLPHGGLPSGCIHEVKGASLATALAFSAILSARLAGEKGNIIYIARDHSLHPPGLLPYGIRLNQLLVVSVRRTQDLAWAIMEALRCPQVSAVMSVFEGADLTTSRRLQLAAENSGATGFLIGHANSAPIASPITRWKISSNVQKRIQRFDEPTWMLDLLYCRGGRPGQWAVEWRNPVLNPASAIPQVEQAQSKRALAG
jgi:protein ImuA